MIKYNREHILKEEMISLMNDKLELKEELESLYDEFNTLNEENEKLKKRKFINTSSKRENKRFML